MDPSGSLSLLFYWDALLLLIVSPAHNGGVCPCIFHPYYCATVYCAQSTASTRAYRITALLETTTVLV